MIISDNSMYGTIGMHSYVRYPDRPFMDGMKLTNPDFAAWGRAFGAEGITIRDECEVAGRHCPRLRGEDQAGGGALPDLRDPDERMAALSGGAAAVARSLFCSYLRSTARVANAGVAAATRTCPASGTNMPDSSTSAPITSMGIS